MLLDKHETHNKSTQTNRHQTNKQFNFKASESKERFAQKTQREAQNVRLRRAKPIKSMVIQVNLHNENFGQFFFSSFQSNKKTLISGIIKRIVIHLGHTGMFKNVDLDGNVK